MLPTRRELCSSLAGAGLLAAVGPVASAAVLDVLGCNVGTRGLGQNGTEQPQVQDQANYDFWSSHIRDPGFSKTRSLDGGSAPRVAFVFYDKHLGFVTGSDIGDAGLADAGDINLLVNVDHMHLSKSDQAKFTKLQGGSLRIDVQQTAPLPSLPERLAWTAIAGLLADNKALPSAKSMTFDPGSTWGKLQTVVLPRGGARWTWNFSLQHQKSRWMQLFDALHRDANALLPIFGLGLPAIAITALQTVDRIVAELTRDSGTEWLFQSPDVFVYGTKTARDTFEGSKLRLKQGMYVLVPETQLAAFSKQAPGLEVKDGLLVPKATHSLDVFEAARQTLPDVTYVTVGVTAKLSNASR